MRLFRQLRALFRRRQLDADMTEELRAHLEMQEADNVARGMAPAEARAAARRQFGGMDQIKEVARAQRGLAWIEQIVQDLRYGARQLRRSPGFTFTAVMTLALGISATTAIFSVVKGLMLKPLPYDRPEQLVQIFEAPVPGARNPVSPGVYLDWRRQSGLLESLAAIWDLDLNLDQGGEPERLHGLRMTADGLALFRTPPLLGRMFAPDEDQPGKEKVVVLTYQLWQRRFGGEAAIINRPVLLNGERYTVIGVLPRGFLPGGDADFVVPYVFDSWWVNLRGGHFLGVYARLKPGVTIEQVHAELVLIGQQSKSLYPSWKRDWTVTVVPLQQQLAQAVRPALLVLLGAVGLVLLIACVNVANLLLAKASARQKEMAVRAALGASRGRIVRQLLAESVLLSLLGAALGLAFAFWFVGGLQHATAAMHLPRAHEVRLDGGVLAAALGLAVLTGLGFGLAPALQVSRPELDRALKNGGRGSSAAGGRLRGGLVVAEVALALMLLAGAGLLLNSFFHVMNRPPGFDPRHAVAMQLSLPLSSYPHNPARSAFELRLLEKIAALPGVEAAGMSNGLSLRGATPDKLFQVAGRVNQPESGYDADDVYCTPGFFRAMGIPLQRGRLFERRDVEAPRVAIISEAMARAVFPGEDPLGRFVRDGNQDYEIVGIVGDMHTRGLAQPAPAIVYRLQSAQEASRDPYLVVRSPVAPAALVAGVKQVLRELDPTLPVANVQTLQAMVDESVGERRLTLVLLALFAGAALLLAAIGLYGVIAYAVTQRTAELGIRLALGAAPRDLLHLILRQAMTLAAVGLGLGLIGAASLSHLLTSLLYEVKPTDPATFAGVSAVLLLVALFAAFWPARRASRVDPLVALRTE